MSISFFYSLSSFSFRLRLLPRAARRQATPPVGGGAPTDGRGGGQARSRGLAARMVRRHGWAVHGRAAHTIPVFA
eukprot:scaffold166812_cov32-Tisochrysis_lutea.AAC.2